MFDEAPHNSFKPNSEIDFSANHLKSIYDSEKFFVFRISKDGSIAFANPLLLNLCGLQDGIPLSLNHIIHESDISNFKSILQHIQNTHGSHSCTIRLNGKKGPLKTSIELSPLKIENTVYEIQVLGYRKGKSAESIRAKKFNTYFKHSPLPMCIFAKEGEIISSNTQMKILLDAHKEEQNNPESNYLKSILWEHISKSNDQVLEEGVVVTYEKEIFLHNELRYLRALKFPLELTESTRSVGAIFIDITQQKKEEYELTVRERRLNSLLNSNSAFLIRIDMNGYFNYVNKAFTSVFGRSNEELKGKLSLDNIFPDDVAAYQEVLDNCLQKAGKVITVELRLFDSAKNLIYSTWEFVAVADFMGYVYEIQGVGWNISNLIAQQEEIKKLALVAQRTHNAVVITDENGVIEWINEGFTRLTEYTLEEAKGKKSTDLLHGPDTNQNTLLFIEQNMKAGVNYEADLVNYSKSGKKYWINIDAFPLYDENGKVYKYMAIESDVTDKKEQELLQHQLLNDLLLKNQNLEEFSYILSHNLRSPVANILGLVNIFKFSQSLEANQHIIESLKKSAMQLDAVIKDVNQIISYRKNLNELKEAIPLHSFINDIVQFFNPELNMISHEIKNTIDRKLTLRTIGSYLQSILYNLLNNSIKYRKPNEKLIIRISSEITDSHHLILIEDNGLGINLALYKDKIFGLYKRFHLNIEGKGMGLFMCRQQMDLLGGGIDLKSTPNVGTTFILTFPLEQ